MAIGDLNGDAIADIAVAHAGSGLPGTLDYGSGSVSVLLGKGDGTFQSAVQFQAGVRSNGVALGDFNGDGKGDLVMANQGISPSIRGNVSVLLGKGDGTFQVAAYYEAGSEPASVIVDDFNRDGKLDVAVAGGVPQVSLLLGNGDGTFQKPRALGTARGVSSIVSGDFNRDGKPDLAVSTDQETSVWLGNGDGTFLNPFNYGTASSSSLVVGDLNNDGEPDLMTVGGDQTRVFLGNGDGSFQPVLLYAGPAIRAAVGDFNGDGKLDWMTIGSITPFDPAFGNEVSVWLNTSCMAGPRLKIQKTDEMITLSWSSPSPGFVLESNASLDEAGWKPTNIPQTSNAGRWEAKVTPTEARLYFRLRQPNQ